MKFVKISTSIAFIFCVFLYSGCGSDTVTNNTPTTITVNGKVTDGRNNAIANVLAIIGSNTATTAADGSFTITGVTTPYDLKLIQSSAVPPTGLVYQGLTTATPNVLGLGLAAAPSTAALTVNIPTLGISQTALVVYTDSVNTVKTATINFPQTNITMNVQWAGSANIIGNLMVLVYTVSGTQVATYDKFGVKNNISLNNGGNSIITFSAADINFNPGESTITGSIVTPAGGYTNTGSRLVFSFSSNGSIFGNLATLGTTTGASYSYVVPTGIANTLKFNVFGSATGPAASSQTNKFMQVQPGSSGNTLTLDEVATLNTPPAGATNIDTTTSFIYSKGSGTSINLIAYSAPGGQNLYVFTTATTLKIPNFNAYGMGELANTNYTWVVEKFGTISSMDNFVSTPLFLNNNLNSLCVSEQRAFTTKP